MKLICYTSCSVNYLAKARVLAKSLKSFHPDAVLVLCLNDTIPSSFNEEDEPFDAVWTPYDLGYNESWVFQHNVMELCTAVKGSALVRLLEEYSGDLYAYFDPDVCIYNDLTLASDQLGDASIGLVPHITEPEFTDVGVQMTEMSVTHHGIYNLGHLFVRNDDNGRALANWWRDRLDLYCYEDQQRGLFTDQRWMDLVPAIFDNVRIMREPNLDVASWNVCGREFSRNSDGQYTVNGIPLLSYHFSGTGLNGVHFQVRNIFNPTDITLCGIEKEYEADIQAQGQEMLGKFPFMYNYFDNGELVTDEIRKLYRHNPDLAQAFPKPYVTNGSDNTFYNWLQMNRSDLVGSIRLPEHKLMDAFNNLFDENYYLAQYPEVSALIEKGEFDSARDHYIKLGSVRRYNPCLYFQTEVYIEKALHHSGHTFSQHKHVDTLEEATHLWHYLKHGLPNNIEPNSFFDSKFYLTHNQDVKDAIRVGALHTALEHYFKSGDAEMRQPCEQLNVKEIYDNNSEVRQLVDSRVTRGVVHALIVLNRMSNYDYFDIGSEYLAS